MAKWTASWGKSDAVEKEDHDNDDNYFKSKLIEEGHNLNTKCHSRRNRCSQQSAGVKFYSVTFYKKLVQKICAKLFVQNSHVINCVEYLAMAVAIVIFV